jgi:hypothetical protein
MAEMFPAVILSSGIAGALDPALKVGDGADGDLAAVESCARSCRKRSWARWPGVTS